MTQPTAVMPVWNVDTRVGTAMFTSSAACSSGWATGSAGVSAAIANGRIGPRFMFCGSEPASKLQAARWNE